MNYQGAASPILYCMTQALNKAARRVIRDFGEIERLQVRTKGPADFVSQADRNAELVLIESLLYSHPDYGVLAEESGYTPGVNDSPIFIIDPIDGTTNFIHGLPHFCLALAVRDHTGLRASAIFDPIRQEMFTAESGRGAWLNDRRIRVSGRSDLNDSLLSVGVSPKSVHADDITDFKRYSEMMSMAQSMSAGVRCMGSASLDLAYVACGRSDAYWQAHTEIWDAAPGALLVKEAGGVVQDFSGKSPRFDKPTSIVASQPNISPRIFSFLKRNYIDLKSKKLSA